MRTKTLLLTAALAAAGIASSKAQVYSVNAVGYVNTSLVPGFNLISNPLDNKNGNKISDLFKNITPTIPNALTIFKFENGAFTTAAYDDIAADYLGTAAAKTVDPLKGEGVFVKVPGSATLTVTFVGEVPQGTALTTQIPTGFSIISSQVPQAGTATSLGLTPVAKQGDRMFKWNKTTQKYESAAFDDILGDFDKTLNFDVGEAFFYNAKAPRTWTRSFSVNG